MIPRRRGSLLMEAVVAVTLIVLAIAGSSKLLIAAGRQQRAIQCRRLAHREAANLMERVMARPYRELAVEQFADLAISETASKELRTPTVNFQVTQLDERPAMRQVEVVVGWRNAGGQAEYVRLVAWKPESEPNNAL